MGNQSEFQHKDGMSYTLFKKSKPKKTLRLLGKVKRFMKKDDASQWTLAALTLAIALLTLGTNYFACEQIKIYEKATHIENRAYLSILKPIYRTNPRVLSIPIRNAGHTKAVGCFLNYSLVHQNIELKSNLTAIMQETIGADSENDITFIEPFRPLDPELFYKIMKGEDTLYFVGNIIYRDVFGERDSIPFRILCIGSNGDEGGFLFFIK